MTITCSTLNDTSCDATNYAFVSIVMKIYNLNPSPSPVKDAF